MRCQSRYHVPGKKVRGHFQCGAEAGHAHAHLTLDEASGGIIFWDSETKWYWWFHASYTKEELSAALEMAKQNNASMPNGISYDLFRQAIGEIKGS